MAKPSVDRAFLLDALRKGRASLGGVAEALGVSATEVEQMLLAQDTLTWDEIVEHCSRLHTTRTRPAFPFDPEGSVREDSRSLEVLIRGVPATIIPTRMHEPGFYYRVGKQIRRSDQDLAELKLRADRGEVRRKHE